MPGLPIFCVRNLGPIQEATVQLRPLTILIGKNNTGKTYMAKSIYAAYKALDRRNGTATPSMIIGESEEFADRLYVESTPDIDLLQGSLRKKAESWMGAIADRAGKNLRRRLAVYFDLDDLKELRRWQAKGTLDVSVRTESSAFLFGLSPGLAEAPLPSVTVRDFKESYISNTFLGYLREMLEDEASDIWSRRASIWLARHLWDSFFLPSVGLEGNAYYLPAGRSGLLEAWTDVVRLRLQQDRDGLALEGRDPAALGGIALDFLTEFLNLISRDPLSPRFHSRHRGNRSPQGVRSAARYLEELIEGDVEVARGRERVPSLTYKQGSESITVQRASSMVAELAPLLSWIKHVLYPGDLLLIDEPEAHMHPEAILAVAQTLVALAGSGVNVLCTTHSSEFLHQVSNSMLRSASQNATFRNHATHIDVTDIGVYRFERSYESGGTRAVSVEIDPRWGIPEDEHVAVADRLSGETAELVESL